MGWTWLLAGLVLVGWLCRNYSFWAVFGWAYAAATMVLIVVCFMPKNRRLRRGKNVEQAAPVLTPAMEFEANK